ncbi:hypothetical protein E2C01_003720 [Portunus trituberculatus]|uniref:Uncharacterized protein n=1 Tax=Portunus trituberculatus TaxID=210409 RepID=A0A5B7CN48_PORTR|nr:hypothetical protein [Portunus trituberculatus]
MTRGVQRWGIGRQVARGGLDWCCQRADRHELRDGQRGRAASVATTRRHNEASLVEKDRRGEEGRRRRGECAGSSLRCPRGASPCQFLHDVSEDALMTPHMTCAASTVLSLRSCKQGHCFQNSCTGDGRPPAKLGRTRVCRPHINAGTNILWDTKSQRTSQEEKEVVEEEEEKEEEEEEEEEEKEEEEEEKKTRKDKNDENK